MLAILEQAAGDLSGKSLLDIGCSAGIMTRYFAIAFSQVVGTDIDQPALRHAYSSDSDEAGGVGGSRLAVFAFWRGIVRRRELHAYL